MKQDAKDYSPITELSKAEADDLLEKAANGELILHAAISAHTAQLFATPFAKVARQGSRKTIDRLVPITVETANRLKFSHDATIENYLAIDPSIYPDTHPLAGHWYALDNPQTVTREQIYFRCDDEDAVVGNNPAPGAKLEAVKGLTKSRVINAFEGLHFDRGKWNKYLGDPPDWLKDCRVTPGSKKASATWNPVLIAAALYDKRVPIKKLDAVFVGLKDWQEKWQEASALFRE